jgi:hypothetical protein
MTHFDLSGREARLLADILHSYLSDLRMEIADTERKEVRDSMKEQKELIIALLEKIEARPEMDIIDCCCREI